MTVAYLRVSGDEQRERQTIALQRAAILEYCRTRGITLDRIYADDGVSSKVPWAERTQGGELWIDAQNGKIKEILIWKIDRAVRKLVHLLTSVDSLDQLGVKLTSITQYVPDGPTGRLMLQVLGAFAEFEKAMILERTREGSYEKAKDPYRWMGGPAPYGYISAGPHRIEVFTEPTTGHRRLASERDVVFYIYTRAAARDTMRTISDYLNLHAIPAGKRKAKAAKRWTPSRIRNMVMDESAAIYKGMHWYGDPPVPRPVPKLAIVSPELWEAARTAVKANASLAKSNTDRQYLLTGLIACNVCNSRKFTATTIHGRTYYRCQGVAAAYSASGEKCSAPHVRGDHLETAVWEDVRGLFLRPGKTLQEIDDQIATIYRPDHRVADEIADIEHALQEVKARRVELERQHLRRPYEDEILDTLRKELADQDAPLRVRLEELRLEDAEAKTRTLALTDARSVLTELRDKVLADDLKFQEQRDIVRRLVEAIRVKVVDGRPEVGVDYRFDPPGGRFACLPKTEMASRWSSRRR